MITTVSGGTVRFEYEGDAERGDARASPAALSVWWGDRRMERHALPASMQVVVADQEDVAPGAALARGRFFGGDLSLNDAAIDGQEALKAILDARIPNDRWPAVIAMADDVIEKDGATQLAIRYADGRRRRLKGRGHACVWGGDRVAAGQTLCYGWRSHHELLRAWGVERLQAHMIDELEAFTRDVPDAPPRAWWTIVVRAMTDWRRVRRAGDSGMRRNEVMPRAEFERVARATVARGGRPPEGVPVLRGIAWMARRRLQAPRGAP